jgi:hypothetical protein
MQEIKKDKEIQIIEKEINSMATTLQGVVIKDDKQFSEVVEYGSSLKKYAKQLKESKEKVTKPMNEALKAVRDMYRPLEDRLKDMEIEIKKSLGAYNERVRIEADKKAAKIKEREEKGTLKAETAAVKLSEIELPDTTVKTESGAKVTEKTIKKYVVEDESKLPREFLMPDMKKIEMALKEGRTVPGAIIKEEKIMSLF